MSNTIDVEPLSSLGQEPLDPIVVFFALTGGAYGVGTWLGKTLAAFLGRDQASWADWEESPEGWLASGYSLATSSERCWRDTPT
jgi:hypothetical protein